ncbi:Uncharacterised protein [Legionella busanensis]|uniref:DUF4381 domain-containing protein n=1 Tax=Legionella busanensis TaxID=190655 RepID=A0A378JQ54_9GAMM|nr:DUF4381 domain-containing protein [Legionella busanensis]STX52841.1 Uncharacterised protein [Legionella busanensis]
MSDTQVLAKLHDIHLPDSIGWWPLAPGWYIAACLSLLIISLLITIVYRQYKYARAKRQACQLLASYEHDFLQHGDVSATCAKISELLKRVALVYFPRQDVASLQGDNWINFLNQTSKNINFNAVRECLLILPYQGRSQKVNLKPLFSRAYAWIKQRGIPCSN